MTRQDVLDALNAERYGTGAWFTSHPRNPSADFPAEATRDDELTCARRRKVLLDAYRCHEEGGGQHAV